MDNKCDSNELCNVIAFTVAENFNMNFVIFHFGQHSTCEYNLTQMA